MSELLQQLVEAVGVSGDEYEVRSMIRDLIVDHVDEWHVDAMGNIIALRKGTGESDLRVMLDAHMDEIGMIITAIDGNGTLQFDNIGGIDPRTLAGSVVQIGRKKHKGVIGLRPVHLTDRAGLDKVSQKGLRIDIGAKDKAAASGMVKVGDRATFWSEYEEVGDDDIGRSAICKAFDDRAACAALIEMLRGERYPFDLYASFSVQEEVGLRGAIVSAYAIQPDVAIVLECTPAYDLPTESDVPSNTRLGHGPCLYVMDRGTVQDPRLVRHIMQMGDKAKIPYQVRTPGGGGTNTASVQRSGAGVIAATIGLPERYAHTAASMINLRDYDNYLLLIDAALRGLTRNSVDRSI